MRKLVTIFLLLLLVCGVTQAENVLSMEPVGETIYPGRAVTISFTAPQTGAAEILLKDMQGQTLSVVVENFIADAGFNSLWWNGTYQGVPAPQGEHQLVVIQNGQSASVPVTVGSMAPYFASIAVDSTAATPAVPIKVDFYASTDGVVTVGLLQDDVHVEIATVDVQEGQQTYLWQTSHYTGIGLRDGAASLTLMLTNSEDFSSNEEHIALTLSGFSMEQPTAAPAEAVEEVLPEATEAPAEEPSEEDDVLIIETEELPDQSIFTPAYGSPYNTDTSLNYWTLPMDITDEEAVWEVLMQPMTILYSSKDKADRTQVVLRAEPSEDSAGVGVVTRINQGVHVLETLDNGWSLIECYSSSFHNSEVKRYNNLVQGYVETSHLKTIEPQKEYAMVIDKLTQRLYLFKEGKLFSTLLVSTGLTNAEQPWNETRSGEFMLTSPVGGFASGNLTCGMAIRFNSGDLLHEVPHKVNADGTKNYSYAEPSLGTKASHGCIRVQRRKTPEGINMAWLWNNREWNTKLLIWEDWQGRQIPIPDSDLQLYYNPKGGELYHSAETCYSAQKVAFEPFSYSQLEDEKFAKLKRCTYCAPALRIGEIEEINAVYAPGGDHDPILTEARRKQLEKEAAKD